MDERPAQPPEGKLIADALERSGMSIRQASKRAGLSYGRWRQITSGVQNVSPGEWARVTGPAATVARMARVVNLTPDQLAEAGREDVAEAMRRSSHLTAVSGEGGQDAAIAAIWALDSKLVNDDQKRGMVALLIGLRQQGEQREGNGDRRTGT